MRAAGLWCDPDPVQWRLGLPCRTWANGARMGHRGGRRSFLRRSPRPPGIRNVVSRRDRLIARSPRRQERRGAPPRPRHPPGGEGAIGSAYGPRCDLHRDHAPTGVQREVLAVRCLSSFAVIPQARQFVRRPSPIHEPRHRRLAASRVDHSGLICPIVQRPRPTPG